MFAWDANPSTDRRLFILSNNRATELVETAQRCRFISLPDGRKAVQFLPPAGFSAVPGLFDDAWKIRPSGGMPVWQMNTGRSLVVAL